MLTRSCFALFLLALWLAACSSAPTLTPDKDGGSDTTSPEVAPPDGQQPDGSTDQVNGQPLTATTSFLVHGQLMLTPSGGGAAPQVPSQLPATQEFVVRIDPTGKTMIAGAAGQALRTALTSSDGVTFQTADAVTFHLNTTACGASVKYSQFTVTARTNGISGTASGRADVIQGDVAYAYNAKLDFTGVPDTQGPSLAVPATGVDPLRGLTLTASEPLPATATTRIVAAGETVNFEAGLPTGVGAVTHFAKPDIALRFATTYDVVVEPWADLSGNAGVATAKIITAPVPPLAAENGFEGAATTVGGAMIVDASVLPPISGQKSVLMTAAYGPSLPFGNLNSTHMTVRLPVAAGDRFVRFSLRALGTFQTLASTHNTSIRVAVPGGAITNVALPSNEMLKTQQTVPGGGNPIWMGDVRTVEVPLPAGATSEVVFDVNTLNVTFLCGLPVPTASYLLDDLRVE